MRTITPLSSIFTNENKDLTGKNIKNKQMINDFLIIDCTGINDSIALKVNNKFFIKKLQTNLYKNETLVLEVVNFIKKYNIKLNSKFSIFVNSGPGSFSGIRVSLSVAKGIQLVSNANIYSYNNFLLFAAPYLAEKKNILTIQKTNNFYYFCRGTFKIKYRFTDPKKIYSSIFKTTKYLFIIPKDIKNDEIIKNLNPKKIRIVEFNLRNIDLLIENKLVENKLIKPLYLS